MKLIASTVSPAGIKPRTLDTHVVTLTTSGETLTPDLPHITLLDLDTGQRIDLTAANAGDVADQLKMALDDVFARLAEE